MHHPEATQDAVPPLVWTSTSGNNIPSHAVPLCEGLSGQLYIARGLLWGKIYIGTASRESCAGAQLYRPDGRSHAVFEYQVLTCASDMRFQQETLQPLTLSVETARTTTQLPVRRDNVSTAGTAYAPPQTPGKLNPFPWLQQLTPAAEMARATPVDRGSSLMTETVSPPPRTPGKLKPFLRLQQLTPAAEMARTTPADRGSVSTIKTASPSPQNSGKLRPFPWLQPFETIADTTGTTPRFPDRRGSMTKSTASLHPQTLGKLKPFPWLWELTPSEETTRTTLWLPDHRDDVSKRFARPSPQTPGGLKPFPWLRELASATEKAVTTAVRMGSVSTTRTASPPLLTPGKLKPFPWLWELKPAAETARTIPVCRGSVSTTRTASLPSQTPRKLKPFPWLQELAPSTEMARTIPTHRRSVSTTRIASSYPQTPRKLRPFPWLRPPPPATETAETTWRLRVRTDSVSTMMITSPHPQTPRELRPFPWLQQLKPAAETAGTPPVRKSTVATTTPASLPPRTPEKPESLPLLQPLAPAAEMTPWLPAYDDGVSTTRAASPPPEALEKLTPLPSPSQTRGEHTRASPSVITTTQLLRHLSNKAIANETRKKYPDDPPPYPGPIGGCEFSKHSQLVALSARGYTQFEHLAQSKCFVLIDDTPSMEYSWSQTGKALAGLVDILSSNSRWDGLDVRFLHHGGRPCVKTKEEFGSVFDRVTALKGEKAMTAKVSEVFEESLPLICGPSTSRPVNLMIMTDGVATDNRKLLEAMIHFCRRLNGKCVPPHMFRIHLLQMGHDRRAVKSLHDFRDRVTQRDRDRRILRVVNFHRTRGLLDARKIFKLLLASTYIPAEEDPDIV